MTSPLFAMRVNMKLKYEFETVEIDGDVMAVPVGDNASELRGMLRLNDTAAAVLKLLKEDTTEEEIAKELQNSYEGGNDEVLRCVHSTIQKLTELNLLK